MTGTRLPSSKPIRVLFVNDHLGFPGGVIHRSTTYLTNTLPAFAAAISSLVLQPERAAMLAAAGQAFALTLTVDKHVQQVSDVYEEIVAGW